MRTKKVQTLAQGSAMSSLRDEYIETVTGHKFNLLVPGPFDIKDIAHALANNCRYTGHVKRRYSVAEHSVLVSFIMEDQKLGDPFEGLMHDAHEAYIGDLASPWKRLMPEYATHEARVELAMRKWAGLDDKISQGAKVADYTALLLEARRLLPSKAADWPMAPEVIAMADKVEDDYMIMCYDPDGARHEFMYRYNILKGTR